MKIPWNKSLDAVPSEFRKKQPHHNQDYVCKTERSAEENFQVVNYIIYYLTIDLQIVCRKVPPKVHHPDRSTITVHQIPVDEERDHLLHQLQPPQPIPGCLPKRQQDAKVCHHSNRSLQVAAIVEVPPWAVQLDAAVDQREPQSDPEHKHRTELHHPQVGQQVT